MSLEMAPFDHICKFLFIFHCNYGRIFVVSKIKYYTIVSVYLTCSKKLTGSQLSPPHGTNKQELSYRKQIARHLRTLYVEGTHRPKHYTVTLKSRLRVTEGHWKRNHWTDHTQLTISRVT